MAIGKTNVGGAGGTGGTLTITAPANVTATVSKDGKSKTKNSGTSGVVVFKGLAGGTWIVTITGDGKTAQKTVTITTDYSTAISFNAIPEFTYTGDYKIVNDSDKPITVSQGNWKIRFLTSGTLKFTNLNGAEGGIDVFLVGGGGGSSNTSNEISSGGGGGGYTVTAANVAVKTGVAYSIVVGAGGNVGANGGASSALGKTASGGKAGKAIRGKAGGDGGSGGGAEGSWRQAGGNGGSNGANGGKTAAGNTGGSGQGTTTREFGESSGKLYSGGGGGGSFEANGGTGGAGGGANGSDSANGKSAAANTGGGAGGAGVTDKNGYKGANGGSGIVIIRNARGVA